MSLIHTYLVALICIFHNAKAINIDKGSDISEMVERLNTHFASLEEMVGKLWKENNELKNNVFALNELVKEHQSRIMELEEKSETTEDKNREFNGQKSADEVLISKRNYEKFRETRLLEGSVNPTIQPTTVAFYAYMSKPETISPHHTLVFDQIETNIGGSYSKHSGTFIAPYTGVYMLTYTVFPHGSGSYGSIELVVNSVARGKIFVDSSSNDPDVTGVTGNAVLSLNQGDVCIVRTHPTYPSTGSLESSDIMRSSFSGVLISQ